MELELWLSLVALFFTGGLTPGPAVMLVLASSFRYGFKPALLPALGVASANVLWLFLAASGTAALFEIYPRATLALKILGISRLFWHAPAALFSSRCTAWPAASDHVIDRHSLRIIRLVGLRLCRAIYSSFPTKSKNWTYLQHFYRHSNDSIRYICCAFHSISLAKAGRISIRPRETRRIIFQWI